MSIERKVTYIVAGREFTDKAEAEAYEQGGEFADVLDSYLESCGYDITTRGGRSLATRTRREVLAFLQWAQDCGLSLMTHVSTEDFGYPKLEPDQEAA